MKIVGVCGAKKVGKDTFYCTLKARGHDVVRVSFADAIKADLSDLQGLCGASKEESRSTQQEYGTAAKVLHGSRYWVDRLAAHIDSLQVPEETTLIVTDVRFKIEARWIRSIGGTVVTVERATGDTDSHSSEHEWKEVECDYHINNASTRSQYVEDILKVWSSVEDDEPSPFWSTSEWQSVDTEKVVTEKC